MKNFIRVFLTCIMALVCCFGLLACDKSQNEQGETGVQLVKYRGDDFYTVIGYVDDGETTSLDLNEYNKDGVVIKKIASNAFDGNDTLTEVIVPNTITEMGEGAFAGMKKLSSLTLPFVGRFANADAFPDQTGSAEEGEKAVNSERTLGYLFGKTYFEGGIAVNNSASGSEASSSTPIYVSTHFNKVKIEPKEEYAIPTYAFFGFKPLQTVELSDKVVAIGSYAFGSCDVLKKVTFSSALKDIYEGAFSGCAKLTTIDIPANSQITKLNDKVFYGTGIKNITLGANITSIGKQCFANSALREITFSVNSVGYGAFADCSSLIKVNSLLTQEVALGNYAFYNCSKLEEVNGTFQANDSAYVGSGLAD